MESSLILPVELLVRTSIPNIELCSNCVVVAAPFTCTLPPRLRPLFLPPPLPFCSFLMRFQECFLFWAAGCGAFGQAPPPPVTTRCGIVSGVLGELPISHEPVNAWLGIPYAAPPVGALRFRPPQPPVCPWSGVRNGSLVGPMCTQPSGAGDEDCLMLNVFAPSNHSLDGAPLPVLVFFHGGNLIAGSAPVSAMEVIAVRTPGQMVAVSVNYRLGVLGFLAVDELAAEPGWVANSGIADAIAALEWIQSNIAAFGGDPTRVTLAGQSSGGTLILALFAAPSAAGLFAGAISLSGSPNITMTADVKRTQDAPILKALNCTAANGFATPAARVACLRALPGHTVALAMPKPSWDVRVAVLMATASSLCRKQTSFQCHTHLSPLHPDSWHLRLACFWHPPP